MVGVLFQLNEKSEIYGYDLVLTTDLGNKLIEQDDYIDYETVLHALFAVSLIWIKGELYFGHMILEADAEKVAEYLGIMN